MLSEWRPLTQLRVSSNTVVLPSRELLAVFGYGFAMLLNPLHPMAYPFMPPNPVPAYISVTRSGENNVAPPVFPKRNSFTMLFASIHCQVPWPEYRRESCRPWIGKPG